MPQESTPLFRCFRDDPQVSFDVADRARHVLTFKPQFANLVAAGIKTQTIRPRRKRPISMRDRLFLREWLGRPYFSEQRELGEGLCTDTFPVTVSKGGITLYTSGLAPHQYDEFAVKDGFCSFSEMRAWFEEQHGLPFDGVCIVWRPIVPIPT